MPKLPPLPASAIAKIKSVTHPYQFSRLQWTGRPCLVFSDDRHIYGYSEQLEQIFTIEANFQINGWATYKTNLYVQDGCVLIMYNMGRLGKDTPTIPDAAFSIPSPGLYWPTGEATTAQPTKGDSDELEKSWNKFIAKITTETKDNNIDLSSYSHPVVLERQALHPIIYVITKKYLIPFPENLDTPQENWYELNTPPTKSWFNSLCAQYHYDAKTKEHTQWISYLTNVDTKPFPTNANCILLKQKEDETPEPIHGLQSINIPDVGIWQAVTSIISFRTSPLIGFDACVSLYKNTSASPAAMVFSGEEITQAPCNNFLLIEENTDKQSSDAGLGLPTLQAAATGDLMGYDDKKCAGPIGNPVLVPQNTGGYRIYSLTEGDPSDLQVFPVSLQQWTMPSVTAVTEHILWEWCLMSSCFDICKGLLESIGNKKVKWETISRDIYAANSATLWIALRSPYVERSLGRGAARILHKAGFGPKLATDILFYLGVLPAEITKIIDKVYG